MAFGESLGAAIGALHGLEGKMVVGDTGQPRRLRYDLERVLTIDMWIRDVCLRELPWLRSFSCRTKQCYPTSEAITLRGQSI